MSPTRFGFEPKMITKVDNPPPQPKKSEKADTIYAALTAFINGVNVRTSNGRCWACGCWLPHFGCAATLKNPRRYLMLRYDQQKAAA